jgi:hypothetical protein
LRFVWKNLTAFAIFSIFMPQEPDSLHERARQADKIVKNPSRYKICEGCDSIVVNTAATCPSCHGYRFNDDSASVTAQARLLAQRERQSVLASDLE